MNNNKYTLHLKTKTYRILISQKQSQLSKLKVLIFKSNRPFSQIFCREHTNHNSKLQLAMSQIIYDRGKINLIKANKKHRHK